MLLAVGIAATLISSVGYVKPVLILGPVFICTACGLLFTLNQNTSSARLVGYQLVSQFCTREFAVRREEH